MPLIQLSLPLELHSSLKKEAIDNNSNLYDYIILVLVMTYKYIIQVLKTHIETTEKQLKDLK